MGRKWKTGVSVKVVADMAIHHCPPQAGVTGSNPVGCAITARFFAPFSDHLILEIPSWQRTGAKLHQWLKAQGLRAVTSGKAK